MVKKYSFLYSGLFVDKIVKKGRGVFTKAPLPAHLVIEIAPVIVMSSDERKLIDKTLLHDYIFEWGTKREQCCMALGYVPIYNHSYQSNCEYEMDFRKQIIYIKTVQKIEAGAELTINYNGDWNNETPVWFDVK